MFASYYWVVEITLNENIQVKTSCDYQATCSVGEKISKDVSKNI